VDIEEGVITVDAPEHLRSVLVQQLKEMGYPERGSVEGLQAVGAKAKSFVSCAIGRLDKE
jgi:copper chaperone